MKNKIWFLAALLIVSLLIIMLVFFFSSKGGSGNNIEAEEIINPGYRWDFNDPAAGTAGWILADGEFWEYSGTAELTRDDITFGKGMLRLDVDFTNDSGKTWSEPKLRFNFDEPIDMTGLGRFVFDFYFDPIFSSGGHFKSKVIALNDNKTIVDFGSGEINGREEVLGFMKATVVLPIRNVSDSMDNMLLSIAGYMTDYKGPVFFDNLRWESSSVPLPQQTTSVQVWIPPASRPAAPEASPNKKRLLNYLIDQYGKRIISGQMSTAWATISEMDMIARVFTDTDKYPAIKGFDFIQLNSSGAPFFDGRGPVNEAIEWWEGKNNGISLFPNRPEIRGIITFCWHWRTGASDEFYSDRTSFRIPWKDGKLDFESDNFKIIVRDLDKAASRLTTLRDRGIPVLWRPLHEASGRWFWWGASGAQPYIALWEYMYDYFTYEKGLNNLIWVWNADDAAWLPDPATVEIVGRDLYSGNYASQKQDFDKAVAMTPARDRMVALTENGRIPDPDECIKDGAIWLWFMTWNDRHGSSQGDTHNENFWTGEAINTQAHKMKVYHHPMVITLDKLPDLTAYRLE